MAYRLGIVFFVVSAALVGLAWMGVWIDRRAVAGDRPAGPPHKTRSAVMARQGMAATSQPLATATAIRVLQQGGNAVDAAIAANAVLGVVEPMSCGIGGDLFAIVWDAKTKRLYGLNASGRAPAAATIDLFKAKGLTRDSDAWALELVGPRLRRWLGPACASDSAPRPGPSCSRRRSTTPRPAFPSARSSPPAGRRPRRSLEAVPTSAACYLPGGHAPGKGDVSSATPGLARSLRAIAQDGRDAFYRGPLAEAIVKIFAIGRRPVFALGFRRAHQQLSSIRSRPITAATTSGSFLPTARGSPCLQMLNLLEPFDLKSMGPQSAEALHLMIEAKKLAYEDRAKYLRRPRFRQAADRDLDLQAVRRPASSRAESRSGQLEPRVPGNPMQADTIYMTVVDKDFNCVSLIQSNFHGFGSHHVPGDLGFALQNRGSLFALDPNHLNRLEPRKRPFHTIIPGFITKDGRPWLSFGLMGGDMQAQGHAQVICNMIDFGMDVQEAGDAPRFRHFGSSEPTGQPAKGGGTVALESGISPEVRRRLEAKGHHLVESPGGFGGYQAIRIDLERGVLIGGSDPRKDGCAMGY